MTARSKIVIPVVCVFALVGCSTNKTAAPPPPTVTSGSSLTERGGVRHEEVTITATVEKVDQRERLVTLRGPDGTTETIRVGPEVRNLPQLRRGDQVLATYYQSVAFEVLKPGEAKIGVSGAEGAAAAELGQRPGAIGARVITLVADIVKLDPKNQQAVLKGPEGKTITVNVKRPEVFDKVKVGDRVEIIYTEAVAIDVQPAPKRR